MKTSLKFDSLLIHGGSEPGPAGATSVPIVQSSSFAYASAESLEDVFRGRAVGQVYTRLGNPTTEALEKRLALLPIIQKPLSNGLTLGFNILLLAWMLVFSFELVKD